MLARRFLNTRVPAQRGRRLLHSTAPSLAVLGLRAEDPARRWERRAALDPDAVRQLVKDGHQVLVERCSKRAIGETVYKEAGAEIVTKLDPLACDVIAGVKEPVASSLPTSGNASRRPAAHLGFFHCHKGQAYNFPLVQTLLKSSKECGTRFIDYELLTDAPTKDAAGKESGGKRTVGFGFLAGYSGMADGLAQLGTKLLAAKGAATPFLSLERPIQAGTVDKMKQELERVGKAIRKGGLDGLESPLVIAITGRGKVGAGARLVLEQLGVEWVDASELGAISRKSNDLRTVYACHLELSDYLVNRTGQAFDRTEYREHPERFESVFHEKIAPYTTVFCNGGLWNPSSPRLLTTAQLAELQANPQSRLTSIVDISCDFDGSLEFVRSATTLDDPIIQYDARSDRTHRDASDPHSVQLSTVEILPSAFPLDATKQFSKALLPYIRQLLDDPRLETAAAASSATGEALRRATLIRDGQLEPKYRWVLDLIDKSSKRHKAVVLGAGLVAGPAIRTLSSRANVDVTIASNDLRAAKALAQDRPNVEAVFLDAADVNELAKLIQSADVVLSLLPAPLHVKVAKLCIEHKAALITASYTSADMAALHDDAKAADIVLLNELGLDPGIDHVTAMRLLEEAQSTGNKIKSFVSFCGGLPSPELSNAPLGYKFSWSPRGVLTAALNAASFRLSGREIAIAGPDLLRNNFPSLPLFRGLALEGVANRDSLSYLSQYRLPSELPTILRGTLRYPGFSPVVDAFKRIGLLRTEPLPSALTRSTDLVDACLAAQGHPVTDSASREQALSQVLNGQQDIVTEVTASLRELSLLPADAADESADVVDLPATAQAPIDYLSTILSERLKYGPHERDMVVLAHEVTTEAPDGTPHLYTSSLVQYGDAEASAMATTVGVPIALGALLYLDGKIAQRGLVSPTSEEVWRPMLAALEDAGIRFVEGHKVGSRGILDTLEKQM
ncbi:hypothetical protein JCM10908_007326 [Rhodotorula pacifica]|uniref:uncharacterized protein n=1 Tax=Rhodotorula pacifica TaxID=1495444 RepID=UPI003181152F